MAAQRSASMAVLDAQLKAMFSGIIIGWIGDRAHQLEVSDHNPDDTPGVRAEQSDADTKQEVRAEDPMLGRSFTEADADQLVWDLTTRPENIRRLHYVIWKGRIFYPGIGWVEYNGPDPHTTHPHVSGKASDDENTAPWALGGDMTEQDVVAGLGANAPYESPGVHTTAVANGEGSDTSIRRLVEYLVEQIRYGKPFTTRDGQVRLPHVTVDEIATPVVDQLVSAFATRFATLISDAVAAGVTEAIEQISQGAPAIVAADVADAVAHRLFGDRLAP